MPVGTVIGFPHGGHLTAIKVFEAQRALADGAAELDMVVHMGWSSPGRADDVAADIRRRRAARPGGALVKVISRTLTSKEENVAVAGGEEPAPTT